MKCGDLLAEVIYKEGAHPEVSAAWVDPALSGAPASIVAEGGSEAMVVVRERFVLDLAAFGRDGNTITAQQYERLCRKARWLDEHGHLVIEAMYPAEQAELDDIDFYADYLLKEHRDGLLAFCFTEDLSDIELREALLRSFEAVRSIALSTRELLNWRETYFFAADGYKHRLAATGALGGGDLRAIYSGLVHLPGVERRVYSAVGPRLLEMLSPNGPASDDNVLVRGSSYSSAVCHTNHFVADTLSHEQRNGLLPVTARVDRPTHVRLDDAWQSGGIWRAEYALDVNRYSLAGVPNTIPLGLGFAESLDVPEAIETFAEIEQPVPSTQTGFRVAVTLRDRGLGRLRLSPQAATALAPGVVQVILRHDGSREAFVVERDRMAVYGVEYPWELHPGIVLSCNIESGGSLIRARTVPVTPPLVAGDGARFHYETNVYLYEREQRLGHLGAEQRREAPSLRELCNRAFRACGRMRNDGARALTLSDLATVILGPVWRSTETRTLAETLATMALDRDGDDYLWHPQVRRQTRASERSLLAAYGEATAKGKIARSVRRHWVPMHLRHYVRRSPSDLKRATYAAARMQFGMHGVLPETLPDDCSWVEPYSWGGDDASEAMGD
jgi:hypothetical protein